MKRGVLYHQEMYASLGNSMLEHFPNGGIRMADFGCGDLSSTAKLLSSQAFNGKINTLIGVDGAPDLLKTAQTNVQGLACTKNFLCGDMLGMCRKMKTGSLDVIFTSYALHHLQTFEKKDFVLECKRVLRPGGIFVMVDAVRTPGQSRDEWISTLEAEFRANQREGLEGVLEHMHTSDFPDTIETICAFVKDWQSVKVTVDKGYCACIVFVK